MLPALAAIGALLATGPGHAASLANNGWDFLFSANEDFDVSVYPGSAGYAGSDDTAAPSTGTFGDGTVEAYAFFSGDDGGDGFGNGNDSVITLVSSGTSITGITTDNSLQTLSDSADIWTSTDPAGFTSTADHTTGTIAREVADWSGTIDISSYSSGTIYFLYGNYRGGDFAALDLDLAMRDTNGSEVDILLLDAGSSDRPNNWEHYVVEIGFVNDLGYDVIDYAYTSANGNGRIGGIVVDAIPEPSSAALFVLMFGCLTLVRRRR